MTGRPSGRRTHICPPDHKHALTANCYCLHRCGCAACREHMAEVGRRRSRNIAYGRITSSLTPAQPAREHVLKLIARGHTPTSIAELANVPNESIRNLLTGPRRPSRVTNRIPARNILIVNSERILATPIEDPVNVRAVRALQTHRRLQALIAMGWSARKLSLRLGLRPDSLRMVMRNPEVTARMHQMVCALYGDLWNVQPPSATSFDRQTITRSLNWAAAEGWARPLEWDDIDEDPTPPEADSYDHTVDELAVELAASGEKVRLNVAERRELVKLLHARVWSDPRIAEFAGCDARTVLRIRNELGLPGWDQNQVTDRRAA